MLKFLFGCFVGWQLHGMLTPEARKQWKEFFAYLKNALKFEWKSPIRAIREVTDAPEWAYRLLTIFMIVVFACELSAAVMSTVVFSYSLPTFPLFQVHAVEPTLEFLLYSPGNFIVSMFLQFLPFNSLTGFSWLVATAFSWFVAFAFNLTYVMVAVTYLLKGLTILVKFVRPPKNPQFSATS